MISLPLGLQIILILGALFVFVFVVYSSRKEKMDVRYAVLWIAWALFILLIGIFPQIAVEMSNAIGVISVTNFVFLVMIGLLFFFNYYLYLRISKMNKEMKKLNYEVAMLKKDDPKRNITKKK